MISFFNTYPEFTSREEDIAKGLLGEVVQAYSLKLEYVNIVFMCDDQLLELNIKYLNHDYYTDILTFNYSELPNTIEAELYISMDRVSENAATNQVLMNEEMMRVIVHGMLHLAGFDDQTVEDRAEMRLLEDRFLKSALFHVKQDFNKIST